MGDPTLFSELISRKILTVEDNHLKILEKVDISSYGSRAWAFTLQELSKKGGKEFLYNLGYKMGEDAAQEILETVKKLQGYLTTKLYELPNLIEITGFGIVEIKFQKDIELVIKQNHIIDYANELYKKDSKACIFYLGVYSAFINLYKNKKIRLKEKSCICKGDKSCIFTT